VAYSDLVRPTYVDYYHYRWIIRRILERIFDSVGGKIWIVSSVTLKMETALLPILSVSACGTTRVGTLIVATIYLQLIQN